MTKFIFLYDARKGPLNLDEILDDMEDLFKGITKSPPQIWGLDTSIEAIDRTFGNGKSLARKKEPYKLPNGVNIYRENDDDEMGNGKHSFVYKACTSKDCKLVAKFSDVNEFFFNEVRALHELKNTGLVPALHGNAYIMVDKGHRNFKYETGIIIMEKVEPIGLDFPKMKKEIMFLLRELDEKYGWLHVDVHEGNYAKRDGQLIAIDWEEGQKVGSDLNPIPRGKIAADWREYQYGSVPKQRRRSKRFSKQSKRMNPKRKSKLKMLAAGLGTGAAGYGLYKYLSSEKGKKLMKKTNNKQGKQGKTAPSTPKGAPPSTPAFGPPEKNMTVPNMTPEEVVEEGYGWDFLADTTPPGEEEAGFDIGDGESPLFATSPSQRRRRIRRRTRRSRARSTRRRSRKTRTRRRSRKTRTRRRNRKT